MSSYTISNNLKPFHILILSIVTCEFTFAGRNDTKDVLIVLHFISKGVNILEIVRNGLPGPMASTYLSNLLLD